MRKLRNNPNKKTAAKCRHSPLPYEQKRLVLITGCTQGIGKAMAEEFIRLGHTVIGCSRSKGEISKMAAQFGEPNHFRRVDIRNAEQVQGWADTVLLDRGVPDILINNAAVVNKLEPLWRISAKEFSRVIKTNLDGVANTIRSFVPPMITLKRGVIINMSSRWGRDAESGLGPYCATKWGVEGMTKVLAKDLPPGMAAVSFNPGLVNTGMLRSTFPGSVAIPPVEWARQNVVVLLSLRAEHNGLSLNGQNPPECSLGCFPTERFHYILLQE